MRALIYFVIMLSALISAQAANTVYKWVDDDGVVHYTDAGNQPSNADAKQIKVKHSPSGSLLNTQSSSASSKKMTAADIKYQITITSPVNDASIREDNGNITIMASAASTAKDPSLANDLRYSLELNGITQGEPQLSNQFQLSNIDRGTHKAAVKLIDKSNRALATSPPVTFHLMRNASNNVRRRPIKRAIH